MRLKTYLATYLLFLAVLFTCFGITSFYMTRTQMNMHRDRAGAQFQTIALSLSRDIMVQHLFSDDPEAAIAALIQHYIAHYAHAGVQLALSESTGPMDTTISFGRYEQAHYIHIAGLLAAPYDIFRLDYWLDITAGVDNIGSTQRVLLLICIGFSALMAMVLYFVLYGIFPPQIEQQLKELQFEVQSKQQFIDNFAHEMRTPLTSIYGYAEYLQKAPLDEREIIDSTQYIMDEAKHMQGVAGTLLTLATLRNYQAAPVPLDAAALFDDIKQTVSAQPSNTAVEILCHVQTDTLHAQEDLVKILLTNLCTNAIKACSSKPSGIINLRADKQGSHIIVSVTDNGHGIPDVSLPQLMEPFYRVDTARSRTAGGAGLGLALCKRIMEVHGGTLAIESTEGIGTRVAAAFTTL